MSGRSLWRSERLHVKAGTPTIDAGCASVEMRSKPAYSWHATRNREFRNEIHCHTVEAIPDHHPESKIRDAYGWKAGQKFVFSVQGDAALMKPDPTLDELAGIAKGASSDGYRDRDERY